MKIFVKHIGKLQEAQVDLPGITVIAGENDTGKSTIGKALFSMMNGLYDVAKRVEAQRCEAISHALEQYCQIQQSPKKFFPLYCKEMQALAKEVHYQEAPFRAGCEAYLRSESPEKMEWKNLEKVSEITFGLISIEDNKLQRLLVQKVLNYEFNGQFSNIFADEPGEITLTCQEECCSLRSEDNAVISFSNSISSGTMVESLYIDDPFLLNQLHLEEFPTQQHEIFHHRQHLAQKLTVEKKKNNIVTELYTETKLAKIMEQINTVCRGELQENKQDQGYVYRLDPKKEGTNLGNLSAGLKTFVILKTLLLNGNLNHGGTVIFDEPEIHLHPEWQLIFAELIVLIQKEFDLRILLATHSPYFLEAIEVYTKKYDISHKCKFYLTQHQGNVSTVEDVTQDIARIYHLLAKPIQTLEDEGVYDD